ncbi:MAG: D-2-hydroxyacid dehydrogenase [Gammaproteobacteria bacterium]
MSDFGALGNRAISAWLLAIWSMALPFTCALTLGFSDAFAADEAASAERVVTELGLRQASAPVRERAGWRKPIRVVIRSDAERVAWLQPAAPGVELLFASNDEDAAALVAGADAVIGFCSEQVLTAGQQLRWIQLPYAGAERCLQNPAIGERNILVTNAQRVYGPEIAEHVMAMLLNFSRGLYLYRNAQSEGVWERGLVPEDRLWELNGKTMLVVGLGGIGTEVARRANALGMNVIATRNSSREGPDFVSYVGLADELMDLAPRADVVVNAAPLTPATTGLFDAAFFRAMKPTAYFINVGRGRSVVTADLIDALEEDWIAGAALDVTDPEPLPPGHPLWSLPEVIITPHVAAGSDLRVERLWIVMRENLRRYVNGEPMLSVVSAERGY